MEPQYFKTVDPTTGTLANTFAIATQEQLQLAITNAHHAHHTWKNTNPTKRAAMLKKLADLLDEQAQEFSVLMAQEMGKPISEGQSEIKKCAWACRFFADNGPSWLKDEVRRSEARNSFVRHEPLGVVLAIMPWNFPFWQVFRMAAPAIIVGNAVILKHAANTPKCAMATAKLFDDAMAPHGLFQNVFATHEQVETIISDSRVRAVTLTGSNRAGETIAASAGKHTKKVVLELGGSDPFIVFDDVDIPQVAQKAVQARCLNSGQSCVAAKRFLIHEAIWKEFTKHFIEGMKNRVVGDPQSETTQIGPMATMDQQTTLAEQVLDAKTKGAQILFQGEVPKKGWFFPPTVLTGVTPNMRVFSEEVFGPVASLYPFNAASEAVALANATKYGLGASIWTRDTEKNAMPLVNELEFGSVFVNAIVHSDPRLPFGGVKSSGFGKELGREGLMEFVNQKAIWVG